MKKLIQAIKKEFDPGTALKERQLLHTPFDMELIICIVLLNIIGLVMIYSASYSYAESIDKASDYFFWNQFKFVAAGIALMLAFSFVKTSFWNRNSVVILVVALSAFLLIGIFIPGLTRDSHGANRWIVIKGVSIQIAEPIKSAVIFLMAYLLSNLKVCRVAKTPEDKIKQLKAFWAIMIVAVALAAYLVFATNNFSAAVIVFSMIYFTMIVLYPHKKWLIIVLAIGIAAAGLLILLFKLNAFPYDPEENFRFTRIRAWLDPNNEQFAAAQAVQAKQSLYAISSGRFFGKGLGQSIVKYKLSEAQNDYILAVIFEELGLFGVLLITALYLFLFWRLHQIYIACNKNVYRKTIVLGVFFHIVLQVVINYGVCVGLLPTTGVTLTFLSAGGSAAFMTLIELGLVLSVDRENKLMALYEEEEMNLGKEDPYFARIRGEQKAYKEARRRQKNIK